MPTFTESRDDSPSHLSNILGVAPDLEKNCVGFARTKGRRCKLPASDARGRAQASRLLEEGTRLLESGEENLDEILKELAPLLLCRRWHQDQAGHLVYDWTKKLAKFHERRRASAGFLLRSPSPAPYRDSERARRYRALAHATGRGSPASRTLVDEILSIARDDISRSVRISSAPPRFSDSEYVDTPSNTELATAATMDQSRSHTHRTSLDINLQAYIQARVDARLAEAIYRLELEYSRPYTYPPSSVGTTRVSHDSSRNFRSDEPRTLRSESDNRIPVPQTVLRTPRITTGNSTHQQPDIASSASAQATSEAETSTSTSRESARPARNLARRQTSQSEEVTRRHVEGECSICFLPLQEDGSDTDGEVEHYDDFSEGDEEESEHSHDDIQDGYEELVWCRRRCGNNFHRDCMESWIDTFEDTSEENRRQPTCPICRTEWVVEQ